MNRLFESSIAAVLRRRSAHTGWTIDTQETSRRFATIHGGGKSGQIFTLRPDLSLRDGDRLLAIGDTKWKLIATDDAGRLRPNKDDLLQMYAYAAAYRCSELVLIYPWSDELGASVDTYLELPEVHGQVTRVHVVCVDVHIDQLPAVRGAGSNVFGRLLGALG